MLYLMRKAKRILQETENSQEYKSALGELLKLCPLCRPNRGCNRNRDYSGGWKDHRDKQWASKKM